MGACGLLVLQAQDSTPTAASGRVLLGRRLCNEPVVIPEFELILGYATGWISGILYLSSRISQLRKNRRRQKVEGLSWFMFMMAICGNLTYGFSVILRVPSWTLLLDVFPWLLGSLGTCLLDFVIMGQFIFYDCLTQDKQQLVLMESPVLSYLFSPGHVDTSPHRVRGIHNIYDDA
jgi:hypothetical protein